MALSNIGFWIHALCVVLIAAIFHTPYTAEKARYDMYFKDALDLQNMSIPQHEKATLSYASSTPRLVWVDPQTLVPHEYADEQRVDLLVLHLQRLVPIAPVPVPVVTRSRPRVILDGHHRVRASTILRLPLIPVWEADEDEERKDWLRVYRRDNNTRITLRDVVTAARAGIIDWGIKGTRHVAVVGRSQIELDLEVVTPRVRWGVWKSALGYRSSERAVADENVLHVLQDFASDELNSLAGGTVSAAEAAETATAADAGSAASKPPIGREDSGWGSESVESPVPVSSS